MPLRPLILITALLAASSSASAQSLVGRWFGAKSPEPVVSCWVNDKRSDGTFEATFVNTHGGSIYRRQHEGTWFHGNGLFVTVTHSVNGVPVNPRDRSFRYVYVYRVLELTEEMFRYGEVESNVEFSVRKVTNSAELGYLCPDTL